MDPDDGAPDDGVPDGLNLGADVDQYNVPAPVVLPASGSTTAAPVQAVVRVDGAGGSGGPSAPPPRRAPATHVDAVDADDVRDTTSQSASASPSAVAMPVLPASGSTTTSAPAVAPGGVDDDEDDDNDFQTPVDFETATARANRLLGEENKIPKLHYKENWHELPSKLTVDAEFESRVDCESIAMAYAESIGLLLEKKEKNATALRYGCYKCKDFKLNFRAKDLGTYVDDEHDGEIVQGRCWVLRTGSTLEHAKMCQFAQYCAQKQQKDAVQTAYSIEIEKFALYATLSRSPTTKPAALAALLVPLRRTLPDAKRINKLKRAMLDELDPGAKSRGGGSKPGTTPDCNELCYLVRAVRTAGHRVDVFVKSGAEFKKIMLELAKAKHTRMVKENKKRHRQAPTKFRQADITGSSEYKAIDDDRHYFYAFMVRPSTAAHLHQTCRRVSCTDMAHIKGFYAGNIYYRYAFDANHHMVPLVMGYVCGNESEASHDVGNAFTTVALPAYDAPSQVDVSDGDKGQYGSFKKKLTNATPFLCTNHGREAAAQKGNKESAAEYFAAAKACTMEDLARVKAKFSGATRKFTAKYQDEHIFMAALQSSSCHLHGVTTEQGAEVQNAASAEFRMCNTPEAILMGMMKLHARQHNEHVRNCKQGQEKQNVVTMWMKYRLAKLAITAQREYKVVRCIDAGDAVYEVDNPRNLASIGFTVKLNNPDWETRCCKVCARDRQPCAKMVAAAMAHGMPLCELVHSTDTQAAWNAQYPDDAATFDLPAGGASPVAPASPDFSSLKLVESDDTATQFWMPPFNAAPRGRPKIVRQQALAAPRRKPTRCSKCNRMVTDHDARTCKGVSELSDQMMPIKRQALSHASTQSRVQPVPTAAPAPWANGKLLDRRECKAGGTQYHVHWRDTNESDDSWVDAKDVPQGLRDDFDTYLRRASTDPEDSDSVDAKDVPQDSDSAIDDSGHDDTIDDSEPETESQPSLAELANRCTIPPMLSSGRHDGAYKFLAQSFPSNGHENISHVLCCPTMFLIKTHPGRRITHEIVGMVQSGLQDNDEATHTASWIHVLAVSREMRRRGFGRVLLHELTKIDRLCPYHYVFVQADEVAVPFYGACGFKVSAAVAMKRTDLQPFVSNWATPLLESHGYHHEHCIAMVAKRSVLRGMDVMRLPNTMYTLQHTFTQQDIPKKGAVKIAVKKTSRASATDLGMPHDDYFFEQQDESMCAKHALNNLMQEALFNEVSMSEIALDLDAQESEVMNSEADGDYDPGTSNHVREDGYFSIEVIAAALSRYGVHLTNLNVNLAAKAANEGKAYPPYDLGKCEGFLIASHDHFYCIRRLGGKDAAGRIESAWFVLNSTESAPKYVETSKLCKTLEKAGWNSVYVATGLGERAEHVCSSGWTPSERFALARDTKGKLLENAVLAARPESLVLLGGTTVDMGRMSVEAIAARAAARAAPAASAAAAAAAADDTGDDTRASAASAAPAPVVAPPAAAPRASTPRKKKVSFNESPLVVSRPRSSDRKRNRTTTFVPGEGGGQASGGSSSSRRRRRLDDIEEETTHCALLCHPVHCPCT